MRDGGDGDGEGVQVIQDMRQALFEAAELCDTGQEKRLRYALVTVDGNAHFGVGSAGEGTETFVIGLFQVYI